VVPTIGEPITIYHLFTVTYGTAAAPYLVLRVLDQLVDDESAEFLLAIPVLRHQTYANDCAFSADDQIFARQTCDQLIELLKGLLPSKIGEQCHRSVDRSRFH